MDVVGFPVVDEVAMPASALVAKVARDDAQYGLETASDAILVAFLVYEGTHTALEVLVHVDHPVRSRDDA